MRMTEFAYQTQNPGFLLNYTTLWEIIGRYDVILIQSDCMESYVHLSKHTLYNKFNSHLF